MISYLKGVILAKGQDSIILNSNGIGFKVFLAEDNMEKLPDAGKELEVFCVLYIRKETLELYGVLSLRELEVFEILDRISGIGPKISLTLSSLGSLEKVKKVISEGKEKDLIKGIGKKKRQMIILELTGKLKKLEEEKTPEDDEALEALINLGFMRKDAKKALSEIPKKITQTEQRVKQALQFLSRAK